MDSVLEIIHRISYLSKIIESYERKLSTLSGSPPGKLS